MKKIIGLSVLALITIIGLSCKNEKSVSNLDQKSEIKVITPIDFKEKSTNQLIVDVRTPKEFAEGHIEGAVNIDFFNENFAKEIAKLSTDKPVYIYCKSGGRSGKSAPKFIDAGFQKVFDLEGGIMNWTSQNFKIEK